MQFCKDQSREVFLQYRQLLNELSKDEQFGISLHGIYRSRIKIDLLNQKTDELITDPE